jgi:hypothetical protein
MKIDVHAAASFMAMHGRVLDRRRLQLLVGEANPGDVLAALDAYRNPDGGYAWGLEPDLRSAENQPAAAMHALEVPKLLRRRRRAPSSSATGCSGTPWPMAASRSPSPSAIRQGAPRSGSRPDHERPRCR